MSESAKKVEIYRRQLLADLLSQCTEAQQNMFARMYTSVDAISSDKINRAYEQIELTIKLNEVQSKFQSLDFLD